MTWINGQTVLHHPASPNNRWADQKEPQEKNLRNNHFMLKDKLNTNWLFAVVVLTAIASICAWE